MYFSVLDLSTEIPSDIIYLFILYVSYIIGI
jgi:hypothetical protein